MIPDAEVLRGARELVERHGKHALTVARERVEEFKRAHDLVAVDTALRVLTACERLLDGKGKPEPTRRPETAAGD